MSKHASNLVLLTEDLIRSGMKAGRGMKRSQASALGIPWPLKTGWLESLVGQEIQEDDFARFLADRDKAAVKRKKRRRRKKKFPPAT